MSEFSHFSAYGDAHMVDVGAKADTQRIAVAEGRILMRPETLELVRTGGHQKGDVLGVARIAGIQAAKKTSELVPLCHPLPLTSVDVDLKLESESVAVHCRARVATTGKTGVEMEALTAVQIALLTIYDMCKGVDRAMMLQDIHLLRKSGGHSGDWNLEGAT